MSSKNIDSLEKFIDHNSLSFVEGKRNTELVLLCGYALHIKVSEEELRKVLSSCFFEDPEVQTEFTKVYAFAAGNNYGAWWSDTKNSVSVKRLTPPELVVTL